MRTGNHARVTDGHLERSPGQLDPFGPVVRTAPDDRLPGAAIVSIVGTTRLPYADAVTYT
jgi:hypothetical protein